MSLGVNATFETLASTAISAMTNESNDAGLAGTLGAISVAVRATHKITLAAVELAMNCKENVAVAKSVNIAASGAIARIIAAIAEISSGGTTREATALINAGVERNAKYV
jgi:hypothetical protein